MVKNTAFGEYKQNLITIIMLIQFAYISEMRYNKTRTENFTKTIGIVREFC
ncbi:hypothetical protein CLOSYM_04745 [[Clostridium] symbiosum ATCC 14940]|uniref:Uncharacterized protein n=1 Tax=[Clostridium] symbiosum ATCC 14940 TaxID=411472 RepID=A0ABC9TQZ6_CLOSY|nr:hypothetical protein CLOSYM_04745 [[Clostridium] symbiosum ATCC 14940]